jgi:hypothetical protein
MKKLFSILILTIFAATVCGQSKEDTVVMQYLSTVKNIPTPTLEIVRKSKRKVVRSANFFANAYDSVQNANVKITAYLFGSDASHARKYYLLKTDANEGIQYKVIDNAALEGAIADLLDFVKPFGLADAEKSVLIRGLTFVYN